jgi:AsmA family protein
MIGSAVAKIKGGAGIPPVVSADSLSIDIRGDKVADLGTFEGWEFQDNSFAISATINTEGETVTADDIDVRFGPNDFSGQFVYEAGDKPSIDIDISSKSFSIGAVLTKDQNDALNESLESSSSDDDGRVIPDVEIPVDFLNSVDGRVQLQFDKISLNDRDLSGATATATLKDGSLDITNLKGDTTFGDMEGSLKLSPSSDTYAIELDINLNKVRLGETLSSVTDKYPYTGHYIDTRLTGTGTNLRQIAASLDGFFWIRGGKRQIENIRFSSMFGDFFTGLFERINPFIKKDPYTTVDCDRYFFELEDGKMETAPVVLIKTDKMNFLSVGSIDLSTETINLGIETQPRKGVGISAGDIFTPFVRVGGTLDKPKATLDSRGTLIEGGAAYATLGLSILGKSLYQRWIKADKSCKKYGDIAREIRTKRDPDYVPAD